MTWNLIMIGTFLVLHFILFSRPRSLPFFQKVGVVFPIVLTLEIVFAIINFILIQNSICNEGKFATCGILSSIVIIVINFGTLVASLVYFFKKTNIPTEATNRIGAEDRRQLN
jgi:hypothetical protein